MASLDVARLIRATLLSVTMAGCEDECPGSERDFQVDAWNIGTQTYADLIAAAVEAQIVWAELGPDEKCRVACMYAGEYWRAYTDGYDVSIPSCSLTLIVDQNEVVEGQVSCMGRLQYICYGRRPLDCRALSIPAGDIHTHLDGIATMEHVSITAFAELAEQLRELGAPYELVSRCLAAALDEGRHVQLVRELGAECPDVEVEPAPTATSLLAIALHNAVEGCVNETWAALLAHHQARRATDPVTRDTYATIAEDETRHAELAWDIHAWLLERLDARQRALVEDTLTSALGSLESAALARATAVPSATRDHLGLPEPARAGALARDFAARLLVSRATEASMNS